MHGNVFRSSDAIWQVPHLVSASSACIGTFIGHVIRKKHEELAEQKV
eukprot:CAMPEP_0173281964 /NCGR_PEP_ID=MMETSP1143-20121109/6541_1 /TAXON_ID=483371 /ORGANISM="non described non described, Strain CCMP2298" /LENGTH=46 /DNA_ID= /DNA_START= /DNA_END= /DNA_ORIENTATION=